MQVDAVVVAAGRSARFGERDKLLADLAGRPLLAWALKALVAAPSVDRLIVVASRANRGDIEPVAGGIPGPRLAALVEGGARRRDSVEAGLRASRARYVAIHDGARPLCSPALVERVIEAASGRPGAIAALPVTETIKEVAGGVVVGHPERAFLWASQTPQVVLRQAWLDAAAAGDDDETDDAAMLARLGLQCAVVEGEAENIKVTRALDLEIVRAIVALREQP